ncbi:hypothetical protein D3C74_61030 [compost metagenome]
MKLVDISTLTAPVIKQEHVIQYRVKIRLWIHVKGLFNYELEVYKLMNKEYNKSVAIK